MVILWGVIAGLFNGIGALCILLKSQFSQRELNYYLNFAAGIMLAAAFFSLLEPAYVNIQSQYLKFQAATIFGSALIVGYLFLSSLNWLVPHLHQIYNDSQKHIMMFVWAIALHKVPEGLAMGISYANNEATGNALLLGILLQNIPEGLSVVLSLLSVGISRKNAVFIASLTGLMQPVGMIIALSLGNFGKEFIDFSMVVAGSALLFVVINEVLPQSYRTHEDIPNSGALFAGFLIMSLIGVLF